MNKIIDRLKQEFHDEDYRYAYDEEFSNSRMATQVRAIREQRGLTQKQLAEFAGMKQSRISELENVNYNAWSISTLRRIAGALGVRLFFGFESWSELLPKVEDFSRSSLQKMSFEDDTAFKPESRMLPRQKIKRKTSKSNANPEQFNSNFLQLIKGSSQSAPSFGVGKGKSNDYTIGIKQRNEPFYETAFGYQNNSQNIGRKIS